MCFKVSLHGFCHAWTDFIFVHYWCVFFFFFWFLWWPWTGTWLSECSSVAVNNFTWVNCVQIYTSYKGSFWNNPFCMNLFCLHTKCTAFSFYSWLECKLCNKKNVWINWYYDIPLFIYLMQRCNIHWWTWYWGLNTITKSLVLNLYRQHWNRESI